MLITNTWKYKKHKINHTRIQNKEWESAIFCVWYQTIVTKKETPNLKITLAYIQNTCWIFKNWNWTEDVFVATLLQQPSHKTRMYVPMETATPPLGDRWHVVYCSTKCGCIGSMFYGVMVEMKLSQDFCVCFCHIMILNLCNKCPCYITLQ